jgi:pimeloyl-ACP methyl ester carboxylesterase
MRRSTVSIFVYRLLIFAGIAVVLVFAGAVVYSANSQIQRWVTFYAWKFSSGKLREARQIRLNGVTIYYEIYGAGRPVLVLHGGLGSIEGMAYQIMALANSHLVIAADSRGHGRSTDSTTPLSYSLMSDDMATLLDQLQIKRVDVVGWSDGGIVGLDLAIRHPQQVRRLVAISANFDVDGLISLPNPDEKVPWPPLRYLLLAPDASDWPNIYRKVITMWATQPHYTLRELGGIQATTLIMSGQFDIVKPEHTDLLAKSIPTSEEVVIGGGTHTAPMDQPAMVNDYILRFLEESNSANY